MKPLQMGNIHLSFFHGWITHFFFSSVQFSHSVVSDSLRHARTACTPGPPARQDCLHARSPCPSPTPRAYSTHVHRVGDAIQPSHPLSSPSPPTFNLSQDEVFSNESVFCIRWPKYWSFGFSISPSNEYSGLISFRMDWFHLLAVQGTLKSLLQHHSSKTLILQH